MKYLGKVKQETDIFAHKRHASTQEISSILIVSNYYLKFFLRYCRSWNTVLATKSNPLKTKVKSKRGGCSLRA